MSCEQGQAVDCRKVLEAVYLYLDGEIEVDEGFLIRSHLDDCSPCLREFGVEREVKLLIAGKCGGERAPEALRKSVLERLRAACLDAESSELLAE